MRVIAGVAKSIRLKTIPGSDTRPTTDRIKETLFNMIAPEIYGCSFLDLFAGSGAIGIEALSRGAKSAVFVEGSRKAAGCIKENLKSTGLEEGARVLIKDYKKALDELSGKGGHFDIVFMDPPYGRGFEREVLGILKDSEITDEETLVIIEASTETDFSWLHEEGHILIKEKNYKTNRHMFVKKETKK